MIRVMLTLWVLLVCLCSISYHAFRVMHAVGGVRQLKGVHSIPSRRLGRALGSKSTESFFCDSCGAEHVKWAGRCNSCKEWNTVKAFALAKPGRASRSAPLDPRSPAGGRWVDAQVISNASFAQMSSISVEDGKDRMGLFSAELDRVLGGGLVKGSVVLLAGEPGIGKSTLLLQLASDISRRHGPVVYVSGEESELQIAMRGKRLGLASDVLLVCDVEIEHVLDTVRTLTVPPKLMIVDSIQTMRMDDGQGALGSITQIRECTARLVQFAKSTGTAVVLIGHVTKTGDVAGPRVLEHMVDAVLCLEGSDKADFRILKASKNRFGSATEVGVLSMHADGLKDVLNPSALFLGTSSLLQPQEGAAVAVVMEGSRAIMAEIQCLVGYSPAAEAGKAMARRAADGFPMPRLALICAVIEKRLKLLLGSRDVYLNIVGGLRISEPTADLAVAIAMVSSLTSVAVRPATAFIGELGLGAEVRGGRRIEQRVAEAVKLGFRRIVLPRSAGLVRATEGAELLPCDTLQQAIAHGLVVGNMDVLIGKLKKHKASAAARPAADEEAGDWFGDMLQVQDE